MRRPQERVRVRVLAQGTAQAPETVRVRGPELALELVLEPAMVPVPVRAMVPALGMAPAMGMARAKVPARETAQGWVAA